MDNEVLIKVEGVSKKFCMDLKTSLKYGVYDLTKEVLGRKHDDNLRSKEFWAVKDISFELRRGEVLGLIGKNGAGKTTLLKILNGLIKPDSGRIEIRGRIGVLIALGAGFNPILTGRENVYVNGSVLGLTKKEIDAKFDEILDFAEIGDFIDAPVQSYSSGMNVRLGFAIASSLNPDILLIDEVLAVGDVGFRTKCYNRIFEVCKTSAVIFVSHSMPQVDRLCNRAMVLTGGKVIYRGETGPAINEYNKLFVTESREWQNNDGVEVNRVTVNGQIGTKIELAGDSDIEIELEVFFPRRFDKIEITVSFLEKSFDLISQSSNRFINNWIHVDKGLNRFKLRVDRIMMGSGLKLISLAIVDAERTKILFWAHGSWEILVNNDPYIPAPTYRILNIKKLN